MLAEVLHPMPSWSVRFQPDSATPSVPTRTARDLANAEDCIDQAEQCLRVMEELDICYPFRDAGFVFPGLLPPLTQVDPDWWGGGLESRKIFGRRLQATNARFLPPCLPVVLQRELLQVLASPDCVKQIRLGHFFFAFCDCRVLVRFNMIAGCAGTNADSCAQSLDVVVSAHANHPERGAHALDVAMLAICSVLASSKHFQHLKLDKEVLAGWSEQELEQHGSITPVNDRWLGRLVRLPAADVSTSISSAQLQKLVRMKKEKKYSLTAAEKSEQAAMFDEIVQRYAARANQLAESSSGWLPSWGQLPGLEALLRALLQADEPFFSNLLPVMTDPFFVTEALSPTRPAELAQLLRQGSSAQSLELTDAEYRQTQLDVASSPIFAVLFGADDPGAANLERLQCPERTLQRLANVLEKKFGVPAGNIRLLLSGSPNVLPSDVVSAMTEFGTLCGQEEVKCGPKTTPPRVVLAFAGHGCNGENHDLPLELLMRGGKLNLRSDVLDTFVDAILAVTKQPRVRTSLLLLVDSCFSGQAGTDVGLDSSVGASCRTLPVDKLTVMASSSADKPSIDFHYSVFLEAVLKGLQGHAVMPVSSSAAAKHPSSRPVTHMSLVAHVLQYLGTQPPRQDFVIPTPAVFLRHQCACFASSRHGNVPVAGSDRCSCFASLVLGSVPVASSTNDELALLIQRLTQLIGPGFDSGYHQSERIHSAVIQVQQLLHQQQHEQSSSGQAQPPATTS